MTGRPLFVLMLLAAAPARARLWHPLHFTCSDGTHVTIKYLNNPEDTADAPQAPRSMRATIGGHTTILRSLPAASGTRYGNAAFTWTEHQGTFTLHRARQPSRDLACQRDE